MNRNPFRKAHLAYWVITLVGLTYFFYFYTSTHPKIPTAITEEVEKRIKEGGEEYLKSIPVHDPHNILNENESFRVTRFDDRMDILTVSFRHKEIKNLTALISFGRFGELEPTIAFGLIKTGFEPSGGINSVRAAHSEDTP
ncbi:hypothetical protein [Coraliomargarita parva]|uniref:hypothetical protein n=1 Tax=Coraliomargarita parva TaxID=3014050 RepID=UPI0022B5BC14|nr:hypothetical protein [Coraliomargarita parva]